MKTGPLEARVVRGWLWTGCALLLLGLAVRVGQLPRTDSANAKIAGISVGLEMQAQEKLSSAIGAFMILAGAGMMVARRVIRG